MLFLFFVSPSIRILSFSSLFHACSERRRYGIAMIMTYQTLHYIGVMWGCTYNMGLYGTLRAA